MQDGDLREIGILCDEYEATLTSRLPYGEVVSACQTELSGLSGAWKEIGQLFAEPKAEILIEQ